LYLSRLHASFADTEFVVEDAGAAGGGIAVDRPRIPFAATRAGDVVAVQPDRYPARRLTCRELGKIRRTMAAFASLDLRPPRISSPLVSCSRTTS
jgi:hypothetical protein